MDCMPSTFPNQRFLHIHRRNSYIEGLIYNLCIVNSSASIGSVGIVGIWLFKLNTHWFSKVDLKLTAKTKISGDWIIVKMASYQYRKSHCGDKTILRPSYLHNGISYTGKKTSLYWIRALLSLLHFPLRWDVAWYSASLLIWIQKNWVCFQCHCVVKCIVYVWIYVWTVV